ncbi:hypothetical protein Gpo141_00004966 [Globisporangium polare]
MFFAFCSRFYWQLGGTYLDACLQFYGIGTTTSRYSTIAVLQGLVALPHAFLILKMVLASLYNRSLVFTFRSAKSKRPRRRGGLLTSKLKKARSTRLVCSRRSKATNRVVSFASRSVTRELRSWVARAYHYLWSRHGILGVEGKYFHTILFIREVVETSLQTNQAYRMSFYLARVWLNRFYVTLLVVNCWLTPLIHFAYKKNEAKKRLVVLICDCALDLVVSVVIPCTILATYYGSYDETLKGFDPMLWYDDVWYLHAAHDFQILLVTSWRDLGTRLVFALGMVVVMSDIKDMVQVCAASGNQVLPLASDGTSSLNQHAQAMAPAGPRLETFGDATDTERWLISSRFTFMQQRLRTASTKLSQSKYSHYLAMAAHGLLFLWGAIILGFHVYAESKPDLSQCLLQVRPWGESRPSCSLVLLDCYSSAIAGSEVQVDTQWRILHEGMVVCILIRHCQALEMPPVLQSFSNLEWIKVYNTTILQWDSDAAIATTHHPHLTSLFFIRVNMTGGELPPGLLSANFPAAVIDIEFSVTNLHSLPPDLDTKWPQGVQLYFELSNFTAVPEAVLRMEPMYLSFYGNPIRELPSELFQVDSAIYLHFGNTLVTSLPANVAFNASSLWFFLVTNTQVAYFPAWVDGVIALAFDHNYRSVYASGTPYCSELSEILNGSRTEFTQVASESGGGPPPSVLMNASSANHDLLRKVVSCVPKTAVGMFPLAFEDEKYGLAG